MSGGSTDGKRIAEKQVMLDQCNCCHLHHASHCTGEPPTPPTETSTSAFLPSKPTCLT
ncbi:uncharacterized protein [Physcomitrium patens]|uniref:uncharacterized protein isoform X3 n=1 Tax=Physcomitrium patens TaxID=3218 RepID=UPI003CCD66DD